MMLKQLQKKLDLNWIKNNKISDILIYGSYNRGNIYSKEIDIAIILREPASVNNKLILAQHFRHKISDEKYEFDVKVVDLNDFLNPGFLGRESILAESYSLIKNDYLAERFGFTPITVITYNLKNLTQSKKKIFYYSLQGRKKGTGILKKLNGKIISKGVLEIPTKHYEEIKDLMNYHKVSSISTFTLKYRILT